MACEHEWSELDYPTPDDKVCLRCCERQRESALRARVAELEAALRDVAERQRAACAARIEWAKPLTHHRDTLEGLAIIVRATPLVTEEP